MFTIIIIGITCLVSVLAMNNPELKLNLIFYPEKIKRTKEWYRFLTSGFIHADYTHLAFNMITLWSLGSQLEATFAAQHKLGNTLYILLYFGSMIIADIPLLVAQY
jgi:membrane associated rhomboid family serine protease